MMINDRQTDTQTHRQTDRWTHNTRTHARAFDGPLSGTTRVSRYQKGKTNLDFTEARDSEWQWHQLGCVQLCTSLQTDNHASTPPLSFLQAGCPSCRPTNSVKALKAQDGHTSKIQTCVEMTVMIMSDRQTDRQRQSDTQRQTDRQA